MAVGPTVTASVPDDPATGSISSGKPEHLRPAIPSLTTERLVLRARVVDDFPDYTRFRASPRSSGVGRPHGRWAAWGMFCHEVAGWALFRHGALMVDLRATGECVGQVGINAGPLFPEREPGWLVYKAYQGRGYATEAAGALRDWTTTLGLDRYVDPENACSIAVAERLGATLDPRQDPEDLVYRHRVGDPSR